MNREVVAGTTEREQKHLELLRAVNNVKTINNHLDDLIVRINGHNNPVCSDEEKLKQNDPSLLEVLETSPGLINTEVESAHQKIDQISGLLF